MRKLATIRIIKDVLPIEGADNIEKVSIDGWYCVSRKGEFKPNDKCIYFEIDSLLPTLPQFSFLEKNGKKTTIFEGRTYEGYRLRTVKLKGQISQGLALPLTYFDGIPDVVGEDVSEKIGVVKYEAPIPACLAGEVKSSFPIFIPRSNEERIQNLLDILTIYKGAKFYLTEKIDGTSSTFFRYNNEFGVCSHNINLKENEFNTYWKIAKQYNLAEKTPEGFAIQGEIAGQGIQKNRLNLSDVRLFVFYVIDINKQEYLTLPEMSNFTKERGLNTVPIINDSFILNHTCEEILEMANKKSIVNSNADSEGIVFRLWESRQKISFKAISGNYLLKEK